MPGRGPRIPLRRRVSASGGLLPHLRTPGGFGSERRSEWLTQPLRNPASRRNRTFVLGRAAPPHQKCDDTHLKMGASRFASILKPGFNTHSAAEGAKPDRAGRRKPAAGVRGPLGELTRGKRDTQSAGRLCEYAMAWVDGTAAGTTPAVLSQADHRYKARTAWIAGFRQSSPPPPGKALCVPRIPGS